MAKANNNGFDGFIGRRGNIVTYLRLGKLVSRSIGKITKEASEKQLIIRERIPLTNEFIASIKGFMEVGFQSEASLNHKTPNDIISSYTLKNVIKSGNPEQEIDYTKVMVSKGKMPATPNVQAQLNDNGVVYTWDTTPLPGQFRSNDQVMLLVYFPESKSSEYVIYGGTRASGTAQLSLLKNETATIMETYISFISADHKNVSNSVYTGQLILPAVTIKED